MDPHQSDKQDPDPHQCDADPQCGTDLYLKAVLTAVNMNPGLNDFCLPPPLPFIFTVSN